MINRVTTQSQILCSFKFKIMKPIIYYFALLPLMAACANDDVLSSSENTNSNEILIDVVSPASSRASELHSSTTNNRMDFNLWCYKTTSSGDSYGRYFDAEPVTWDSSTFKWMFSQGKRFWPKSYLLKFYAFHGLSADYYPVFSTDAITLLKDFTISNSVAQDDVLFAYYGETDDDTTTHQPVTLQFRHLLAQISALFINYTGSVALVVDKIVIGTNDNNGLHRKCEKFNYTPTYIDFGGNTISESSSFTFPDSPDKGDIEISYEKRYGTNPNSYPIAVCMPGDTNDYLSDDYAALMLPQTISDKLTVSLYFRLFNVVDPAKFKADGASKTPVELYDMLVTKHYGNQIYSTADETVANFTSFEIENLVTTFEMGKKYVLKFLLQESSVVDKFGYTAITFEVKAENWPCDISDDYDIDYTYENSYCLAPTIRVEDGVVIIQSMTDGATIYYTIDGSEPTTSSTMYDDNNRPTVTIDTTIKAIAVKSDLNNSDVTTYKYTNTVFTD